VYEYCTSTSTIQGITYSTTTYNILNRQSTSCEAQQKETLLLIHVLYTKELEGHVIDTRPADSIVVQLSIIYEARSITAYSYKNALEMRAEILLRKPPPPIPPKGLASHPSIHPKTPCRSKPRATQKNAHKSRKKKSTKVNSTSSSSFSKVKIK